MNLEEIYHNLDMEVDINVEKKVFIWNTTFHKKIIESLQIANCN